MNASSRHLPLDRMIDLSLGLARLDAVERSHLRTCAECEGQLRELSGERARAAVATNKQPVTSGLTVRRAAIGLTAAAIVTMLLLVPRGAAPVTATDAWLPVEIEPLVARSATPREKDTTTGNAALDEALERYARRDVRGSIESLRGASIDERYEGIRDVYLASALTIAGELEAADDVMVRVDVPSLPQPWRDRGRWIRQCVARLRGDEELADALLLELTDSAGEIGARARSARAGRPDHAPGGAAPG